MAKNKQSIWSVIILVATIVSLVLLISGIITLVVGLPAVREAARQAAIDNGLSEEEALAAALLAGIVVIVVFAISAVLDVLKIVGGFMFSLKGRWGIFCIIVAILGAVSAVGGLLTDITNRAGAGSIIVDSLTLLVDVLLVVACFMHRKENA